MFGLKTSSMLTSHARAHTGWMVESTPFNTPPFIYFVHIPLNDQMGHKYMFIIICSHAWSVIVLPKSSCSFTFVSHKPSLTPKKIFLCKSLLLRLSSRLLKESSKSIMLLGILSCWFCHVVIIMLLLSCCFVMLFLSCDFIMLFLWKS